MCGVTSRKETCGSSVNELSAELYRSVDWSSSMFEDLFGAYVAQEAAFA